MLLNNPKTQRVILSESVMTNNDFFDETSDESQVKKAIVAKYFRGWSYVMVSSVKKRNGSKIGYVDLFSGPGKYNDGTPSTPLTIINTAIQDSNLRKMLVMIFNDKDSKHVESLQKVINEFSGIESLNFKPEVYNKEVDEDILKILKNIRGVPTLFFVDPWGYKGISKELIKSLIQGWGCDCILFFNYLRINMALKNPFFQNHMIAFFGQERFHQLQQKLNGLDVVARESVILEETSQALKDAGGKYVLPFCFKNTPGTRTNHFLIFMSKGFTGYEIMKTIMAGESTQSDQGVPSFEYCSTDEKQPLLFELTRPLQDLENLLLKDFAGKILTMRKIYEEHNIGKPYIEKNYKEVLEKLEREGKIIADPNYNKRRKYKGKVTFGPNVKVTFPERK